MSDLGVWDRETRLVDADVATVTEQEDVRVGGARPPVPRFTPSRGASRRSGSASSQRLGCHGTWLRSRTTWLWKSPWAVTPTGRVRISPEDAAISTPLARERLAEAGEVATAMTDVASERHPGGGGAHLLGGGHPVGPGIGRPRSDSGVPRTTASATRSARTVSATSCTRTMCAPPRTASVAKARLPSSRRD